jgi:hypothetical protein
MGINDACQISQDAGTNTTNQHELSDPYAGAFALAENETMAACLLEMVTLVSHADTLAKKTAVIANAFQAHFNKSIELQSW